MIFSAPASRAAITAVRPTPPRPMMATEEPGTTLAPLKTAPAPVITAQPSRAAMSIGTAGSIFTSDCGISTAYCA